MLADVRAAFAALPRSPSDENGPVFEEPWQAQAFALAIRLSAEGHFTWTEWAAALAAELQAAARPGAPEDGCRYYERWLAALERVVESKGLVGACELVERRQAWAHAYEHTPHGAAVRLRCSTDEAAVVQKN